MVSIAVMIGRFIQNVREHNSKGVGGTEKASVAPRFQVANICIPRKLVERMVNLHELAEKDDLEAVRKFVKRSPSKVDTTNREGQTALHCAAKGGRIEVCRDLIEAGANPNTEDGQSRTPMWIAVENNRAGVVQLLCETGTTHTTSQAGPEGRTPLHIAARKGFVECAELLLKHGAAVEGNPDRWGKTPGDDCVTSDIRLLIDAARRERAATFPEYTPQVPTAPPLAEENYAAGAVGSYPYPEGTQGGARSESEMWSEAASTGVPSVNPIGMDSPYGPTGLSSPYHPPGMSPPFNPGASDQSFPYKEVATSTASSTPFGRASGSSGSQTPVSKAREAAKAGGNRCSACFSPERSRQLMPCNHIVCGACARRARNEGENVCPVCREHIFDDIPLMTST